jgi:hypothetical protein
MADFLVRLSTDDSKCTDLFGEPMTTEGLTTAMEAAFAPYGVVVDEVIDVRDKGTKYDAQGHANRIP